MAARPRRLRVVSFNIQHGLRNDRPGIDIDLTARSAAGLRPDILGLQEVDVRAPRSGFVDQAERVSAACGLTHRFGRSTFVGGVGRYGNVLAARGSIDDVEVHRLPRRRRGTEVRTLLAGRVTIAGELGDGDERAVALTIGVTHLSVDRAEVFEQLDAALGALVARPGPWLLIGDLNLRGDEVRAAVESAGLRLADPTVPTFPADVPAARIDHIAVGGDGIAVTSVSVETSAASDHRPLVAEVDVWRPA